MENKELKHGLNNIADFSNKNSATALNEKPTKTIENLNNINDVKESIKKKHNHTNCKGCDGICCSKKDTDKVQANS